MTSRSTKVVFLVHDEASGRRRVREIVEVRDGTQGVKFARAALGTREAKRVN